MLRAELVFWCPPPASSLGSRRDAVGGLRGRSLQLFPCGLRTWRVPARGRAPVLASTIPARARGRSSWGLALQPPPRLGSSLCFSHLGCVTGAALASFPADGSGGGELPKCKVTAVTSLPQTPGDAGRPVTASLASPLLC